MNICLIGSAPSSVYLAPYQNPDWQIWGCSPGAYGPAGPHADAWFEIHRYEPGQPWFSEGYCKFLENADFPVYMAEHTPRVKNCVPLPVDELVAKYSPYFFNSTLSWMMALAIEAGAKKIALYGVDMAAAEEYFSQKMGLLYFALKAQELGIEVGTPPESDLLVPPPLYGVCETNHAFIKTLARQRELEARLHEAEQQQAIAAQQVQFIKGAIDDNAYHQQTWHANMEQRGRKYLEPRGGARPVRKLEQVPAVKKSG
jgi:hypothetical protein